MDLKKLITVENAFHLAGIAATAFSAKAATAYLQTLSNGDPVTAYGFAGVIGVTVFACWTFAFLLKPKQRDKEDGFRPLVITAVLSAAMLSTAVSGYTVYQSSMIPLQQAAVEAAKAQDAPLQAKFNADQAAYNAQFTNLQTSITDLRNQKTQVEAERTAIAADDKSRNWKQAQAQKKLDELQASIDTKIAAQAKLTAPVFVATKPESISEEQHRANLARAFFYELSGVLMMFFAYLSRRLRRTADQAAANPLLAAIAELDAARARANQTLDELYGGMDVIGGQAAQIMRGAIEAAEKADQHITESHKALGHAASRCISQIKDAGRDNLQLLSQQLDAATKTIQQATTASLGQLAEATNATIAATEQAEKATTAAKVAVAKAVDLQTSPLQVQTSPANVTCKGGETSEIKRPSFEETILLLKIGEIEVNKFGQVSVSAIQKRSGLGRDLAGKAQDEAVAMGILFRDSNGYCYYSTQAIAQPPAPNVVQLLRRS